MIAMCIEIFGCPLCRACTEWYEVSLVSGQSAGASLGFCLDVWFLNLTTKMSQIPKLARQSVSLLGVEMIVEKTSRWTRGFLFYPKNGSRAAVRPRRAGKQTLMCCEPGADS